MKMTDEMERERGLRCLDEMSKLLFRANAHFNNIDFKLDQDHRNLRRVEATDKSLHRAH